MRMDVGRDQSLNTKASSTSSILVTTKTEADVRRFRRLPSLCGLLWRARFLPRPDIQGQVPSAEAIQPERRSDTVLGLIEYTQCPIVLLTSDSTVGSPLPDWPLQNPTFLFAKNESVRSAKELGMNLSQTRPAKRRMYSLAFSLTRSRAGPPSLRKSFSLGFAW